MAGVRGQDSLPTPAQISEKALALLSPLAEFEEEISELLDRLADDEDLSGDARKEIEAKLTKRRQSLQRSRSRFEALLTRLGEKDKAWTEEHYIQVSYQCLNARRGLWSAEAADLGLERLGPKRFLLDQRGLSYLQLAADAEDEGKETAWLAQAEESFLDALKQKPDTFHAHFGLSQVYELQGESEKTLECLTRALAFAEGRKRIPFWRFRLGGVQLDLGRYEDCLETVDSSAARKEAEFEEMVLALRAHALLGHKDKALSRAKELDKGAPDDLRCVAVRADLLAHLGKREEALALIQKRMPKKEDTDEGSSEESDLRQSLASLAVLLRFESEGSKDAEKLRKDLTAAVGHRVFGMSSSGGILDMGDNPAAMLSLLDRVEESPKTWAEEILRMLCQRAMATYRATKEEEKFCKQFLQEGQLDRFKDEDEHKDQRHYLENTMSDPDFVGAFVARRLLKRFR